MDLKKNKKGYVGGLQGEKRKGELYVYTIISKTRNFFKKKKCFLTIEILRKHKPK